MLFSTKSNVMNRYILLLSALVGGISIGLAQKMPTNEAIEKRIELIMSKMTLAEKVGQTCQITLDAVLKTDATGRTIEPATIDPQKLKTALETYKVGSILNVSSHTLTQKEWMTLLPVVHESYLKKQSAIPVLYGLDAIHGVNYTVGATLFPQEIGLAATWNRSLATSFGQVTAYELRASGIPWNFSPVLDLGRQPLWSRFFETLGEDPYLAAQLGQHVIKGYQGANLSGANNVAACMKHFVGYSFPLSGRDRTPAWIPANILTELYLPPFKAAVDAGAMTVMINSGEVNGIPGHINHHLLTEVLKKEWGFNGFAVSDWEDYLFLRDVHTVAKDYKTAIAQAMNAGLDMSMVPNNPQYQEYCQLLTEAMNEQLIPMERLDDAVKRILRVKLLLGIFEKPYTKASDYPDFASAKHQQLALQSAEESITLLKNEAQILPLKKGQKILVTGPTANNLTYINGAWTHTWQGVDTSFNTKNRLTIKAALEQLNGKENVAYSETVTLGFENGWEKCDTKPLSDFEQKALASDVIVICLGENPGTEKPGDIRSLDLPKEQLDLVHFAATLNKPIIVVLTTGRPRVIHPIVDETSAIIQAYLPGDFGGEALANIIFGITNPSGKLPYSYPKYNGIIEHYDHKNSEAKNGKSNKFDAYDPEWDFGFGLSYCSFVYSDLQLSNTAMQQSDSIIVSVTVTNKSSRTGKEVVQLYIRDEVASDVPWGKRLRDFEKIELKANESRKITFVIATEDLTFVNSSNKRVLEPGYFEVMIEGLKTRFELK